MSYQPKVENVERYSDSQGTHTVCRGKLKLLSTNKTIARKGNLVDNEGRGYTISKKELDISDYPDDKIIEPIIISETEEIEEGDAVYRTHYQGDSGEPSIINVKEGDPIHTSWCKVLSLPEQFSNNHLQAIIDGKMGDRDEVLIKCEKNIVGHLNGDIFYYDISLDRQDHITLFPAKQPLEDFIKAWMDENPPYKVEGDHVYKAMKATAAWCKKNNY